MLLWAALQKRQSLFTPYDVVAVAVDYLLNVCGILFSFTAYSSAPAFLVILLAAPATLLLLPLLPSSRKSSIRKSEAAWKPPTPRSASIPNRPFLTNYRGAMLIATCIGILAVDFPVFPRRFAKVETWGTSIMDLGVGLFVFSGGVVSARALLQTPTGATSRPALHQRLLGSLRHSVPLLVLGLVRLYSVKGLDYAEHVTEYGVHWNFFFTLALLPPFVELTDSLTRHLFKSYDLLAISIAIAYEVTLNSTDLLSYILISPRGPSLLSKNREGVFSFAGYLAIFLSGRSTGLRVLPFQTPPPKGSKGVQGAAYARRERVQVMKNLGVQLIIYSVMFVFCVSYYTGNLQVSRRLANAPYVFLVAAYNNFQILLFALIEHFGPNFSHPQVTDSHGGQSQTTDAEFKPEEASSRILQAFNKNGLPIFLVSNLLTGLVNLTVNTLDMNDAAAMGILIGYMAILTGIAVSADAAGIRLKL